MSCSLCSDVTSSCRVDLPRISTLDTKGGECAIEPGKIGDLGSKKFVTPYNVTYYQPGVTIREFNHEGLRLPQKREFLGPEFFNSGCTTLYGNNRFTTGPNTADTDSKDTMAMFDYTFATRPYFEGNNVTCSTVGAKCAGPNSPLGWMMDPQKQLFYKLNNPAVVNAFCNAQ
jgi:hypothetical protein